MQIDMTQFIGKNVRVKRVVSILDKKGAVVHIIEVTPEISLIKSGIGVFDSDTGNILGFYDDAKIIETKIDNPIVRTAKKWAPWELNMLKGAIMDGKTPLEFQRDLQTRNVVRTEGAIVVAMTNVRKTMPKLKEEK